MKSLIFCQKLLHGEPRPKLSDQHAGIWSSPQHTGSSGGLRMSHLPSPGPRSHSGPSPQPEAPESPRHTMPFSATLKPEAYPLFLHPAPSTQAPTPCMSPGSRIGDAKRLPAPRTPGLCSRRGRKAAAGCLAQRGEPAGENAGSKTARERKGKLELDAGGAFWTPSPDSAKRRVPLPQRGRRVSGLLSDLCKTKPALKSSGHRM